MNICFVNNEQINPFTGGVEKVCYNLIGELICQGHRIICCYTESHKFDNINCGVQKQLPDSYNIEGDENVSFLHNIFINYNVDIIWNHSHTIALHNLCVKAKYNTSTKLVFSYHTDPLAVLKGLRDDYGFMLNSGFSVLTIAKLLVFGLKYPLRYILRRDYIVSRARKIYQESDAYVLLSHGHQKTFVKYIGSAYETKLCAINNPIDNSDNNFDVKSLRKKQILFIGRLCWQKRLDRLMKTWRKLQDDYPDWKLIVVGDGPERDLYEAMAIKLKLTNIYFKGLQKSENYYRESDILCMTSSAEGFGMVLVEAQQHGCVPIAYDSFGAVSDIIEDGVNGFRVKPFSQKEYVKRLRQLMDDENLRQKMGANGLESAKKFDSKKITAYWIELFNEICR